MKRSFLALSAVLSATALFVASCENEGGEVESIYISPSSASLREGQSVALTAGGGLTYTWALSNPAIGSLSSTKGPSVVYTALACEEKDSYQQVTATSLPSTGGSNETSVATGTINIRHIGNGKEMENLSLSASSTSVNVGEVVQFSVVGGDGGYTWSVSCSCGRLSSSSGSSVQMTALCKGSVTVSVRDKSSAMASETITVGGGTADALELVSSATATTVNGTIRLTVSGGTAPYAWESSRPDIGKLSKTSGNSLQLTGVAAGSTTVTVLDAANVQKSVNITISK